MEDHIIFLLIYPKKVRFFESYCIFFGNEFTNLDLVKNICKIFDKITGNENSQNLISFVKDRKGHDFRYSVNSNKIQLSGWKCEFDFTMSP